MGNPQLPDGKLELPRSKTSGASPSPEIPSAKLEPDLSFLPGGQVRTTPKKIEPPRSRSAQYHTRTAPYRQLAAYHPACFDSWVVGFGGLFKICSLIHGVQQKPPVPPRTVLHGNNLVLFCSGTKLEPRAANVYRSVLLPVRTRTARYRPVPPPYRPVPPGTATYRPVPPSAAPYRAPRTAPRTARTAPPHQPPRYIPTTRTHMLLQGAGPRALGCTPPPLTLRCYSQPVPVTETTHIGLLAKAADGRAAKGASPLHTLPPQSTE